MGLGSGLPVGGAVAPGGRPRRAKAFSPFPSFPSFSLAPVRRRALPTRQRLTHEPLRPFLRDRLLINCPDGGILYSCKCKSINYRVKPL